MDTDVKGPRLLDDLRLRSKSGHMNVLKITPDDLGKVFVLRKGEGVGKLVTREQFYTIPVSSIQTWDTVNEFDINVKN